MFGILKKMRRATSVVAQNQPAVAKELSYLDVWQRCHTSPVRISDTLLRARLGETVAWCDSLRSIEDLRSDAFGPSLFHEGADDLVCGLGLSRHHVLSYKNLPVSCQSLPAKTGRFMLYFPDDNLSDGYSKLVSHGFFDDDNAPPWDTWVSFFVEEDAPRKPGRRYLLCYVPAPLIDMANAGIEGNAEECIVWLEQSDVSIGRRVELLVSLVPR